MISLRLAATELRRLAAGTLPKLALAAFVIIPSLYSGLYLFANEDPYGRLDEVPAALVVTDEGATTTDEGDGSTRRVDYGQDVADRLLDGDAGFHWIRTTQADAEAGVRTGRFDAALIVGPSFSADLVSPAEYRPRQASLTLVTNDANNYLSATIADTIAGDVRDAIATEVGTEAADRFLQGFGSIHTNLADAVQGADRLVAGTAQLSTGASELVGGTDRLAQGAAETSSGASALASGAQALPPAVQELTAGARQLASGLHTLRDRTSSLPADTRRLADGAQQVAAGDAEVARLGREAATLARDVADQAVRDRGPLDGRLAELVAAGRLTEEEAAELAGLATDVTDEVTAAADRLDQASQELDRLAAGSAEVAAGAQELADAAPALTQGIAAAATGADELAAGAGRLKHAARTLVTDLGTLADGTAQVSQGADEVAAGSVTLADGTTQVASGVTELRDGLQRGLGAIPDLDQETERATARTIGDPVRVAKDQLAPAGSYGAGLAPFFMALATWIGGYVLFLLVRPMSQRALAAGAPAWQTAVGGWLPAAVLGAAQVAVMTTLVAFALDIRPVHGGWTVVLLLLASGAFVAILQALNVWWGVVGEFLGLVLMLVQLVTAGGTFPWQTIPEPLLSVHRLLPMSYTVEGLRQTLYGGDLAIAARDAGVLAAVLVAALLATTWAAHRRRTWTPQRLQPELVL
ncbi:YhgE/Pip domain-containing protein [Cellulomonas wangsupingiae]|uniref:YhgE/Pip domain-containing protein n=1 Tax=Cellulomonas wangsupingiae TaxID=2968085 RepID=A0ABY5KAQ4_9CELL|nr:YhgE/Pip domain-containing protein [Cellulomonas wangsupingiae]MCC2333142.1 YhgE/Pip domain-containing protein [Cellulomonas wangsupingiae]UUI66858.1 YhgE/Pip domain-containing protein [Cellulomonas wangsupingiae]